MYFGFIYLLWKIKKPRLNKRGFLVPRAGLEPAHLSILVFETNASTNSATWAIWSLIVIQDSR